MTVTSVSVPAGSYVVTATGIVGQIIGSDNIGTCDLNHFAETSFDVADHRFGSYALTGVTTLSSPGTIELDCVGTQNASFGPDVQDNQLVAIQVDALN